MDAAASAPSPLIALVGNPNCGKTALFNILTGSRQKVANYAGVTVERKEGSLIAPSGSRIRILDLPRAYSLDPLTPDEQVTADVRRILGVVGGDRLDGVTWSDGVDALVLHPLFGPVILAVILFLVFQAVFAWAQVPMDEIKLGVAAFGQWLGSVLPGSLMKNLLIDGVLAGVGSLLVFLPPITVLFFFILLL